MSKIIYIYIYKKGATYCPKDKKKKKKVVTLPRKRKIKGTSPKKERGQQGSQR